MFTIDLVAKGVGRAPALLARHGDLDAAVREAVEAVDAGAVEVALIPTDRAALPHLTLMRVCKGRDGRTGHSPLSLARETWAGAVEYLEARDADLG